MILVAWGWCTGTTQRDGMGREEGEGFGMWNTCIPVADSCRCMAKPIQYCKVINHQLKKKKAFWEEIERRVAFVCRGMEVLGKSLMGKGKPWEKPEWS